MPEPDPISTFYAPTKLCTHFDLIVALFSTTRAPNHVYLAHVHGFVSV